MAKPIPKELKDEISTKITTECLSDAEAARRYGVMSRISIAGSPSVWAVPPGTCWNSIG